MAACFSPSASVTTARRSRSAFICRAMELEMSAGGFRSLISIRVTLIPHGSVAASMAAKSLVLIESRCESTSSSSIEPTTVRRLVMASWPMA